MTNEGYRPRMAYSHITKTMIPISRSRCSHIVLVRVNQTTYVCQRCRSLFEIPRAKV